MPYAKRSIWKVTVENRFGKPGTARLMLRGACLLELTAPGHNTVVWRAHPANGPIVAWLDDSATIESDMLDGSVALDVVDVLKTGAEIRRAEVHNFPGKPVLFDVETLS